MTFVIPTAVHVMQVNWDIDPRARGAFSGVGEAQPGSRIRKGGGSLPLTDSSATGFINSEVSNSTGPLRGVFWEFLATGGYDVSVDTKVMVWNWQFNAPNRIQVATAANNGLVIRVGTGAGSPPSNYRTWQIAGNDKVGGQARENPKMLIVDLNVADHDAIIGTFDNTDVQCVGFGTVRFNISGNSDVFYFHQKLFVFDTAKASTNIPRFTGTGSSWDDMVTAMGTSFDTKITDEWIRREGQVFSYAAPVEIGDNATPTTFNDNGVSVFWPNSNDPLDPRVRVTEQAFRMHLNLRNNASDAAIFSGAYDCGDSYPLWDFDQDDLAVVTLIGAVFKRTGTFLMGSSVSGNATFDDCGVIDYQDNGVDLDGSLFKNPHSNHLVSLAA